jgi:hypothetical protein
LIAAFRNHDALVRLADGCLKNEALKQLQLARRVFGHQFASLTGELIRNPDGVLYGNVLERDYGAEREREHRRDAKLVERI